MLLDTQKRFGFAGARSGSIIEPAILRLSAIGTTNPDNAGRHCRLV